MKGVQARSDASTWWSDCIQTTAALPELLGFAEEYEQSRCVSSLTGAVAGGAHAARAMSPLESDEAFADLTRRLEAVERQLVGTPTA